MGQPYVSESSSRPVTAGRIWIVDDSALETKRAASGLDGYLIETFANAEAMLERIGREQPPDVLIIDWVMPGLSGPEAVRFLRKHEGPQQTLPVLLLTVNQQAEQVAEALDAGANDFMRKPYELIELRARVDALLRGARLLERATAAERALRTLLGNAPDPLLSLDAHGVVTFANERATDAFQADVVGRAVTDLLPSVSLRTMPGPAAALVPLPDAEVHGRIYSPALRGVPVAAAEQPPTPDERGATTAVMLSLRDVTERRRAEERRLDFYSVVAHDLRTPLTAMMLRTELLRLGRRGSLDERAIVEVDHLERGMKALLGLINEFLDIARLEGIAEARDSVVDLTLLAEIACTELRPLAEAKGIELRVMAPALPARAFGNERQLHRVFTNLISNALKFTPNGGALSVAFDIEGGFVQTSVTDSGPGIAPDRVAGLFDRFSRGSDISAGTGLGLMIVKETIEAHGGAVGVRSAIGAGSTFWFRLALAEAEAQLE